MPLGCRNIEPVRLGAHTVDQEGEDNLKIVHLTVANNAIVGTLLQLSSLVRHADDLFCDISDECQKVIERTEKISLKLKKLESVAEKLDAKQVTVPEGDLKQFSGHTHYHEAKHGYNAHIFLPTNRPQCVQDQYSLCAPNPVKVIRAADLYRRDGLSGSKYFKCWPVVLNEQTIKTPDLNLPRRVQRVRSFEKKYKQLRIRERPKTIHGAENFMLDDSKNELMEERNQNEQCLTTTEPPVLVSIDTSGTNFERMQSLRLSGRRNQNPEEREKKKKRRRTVSGVPDHLMFEIEQFERKQKSSGGGSRQTPRSYSFDDLDAEEDNTVRDEGIVKYLDEIDGKMEERYEEEKALKIMKFFPCRRSRSLPRCVKLSSVNRSLSAERKSQRERDLNTTYGSSSLSVASLASSASSRVSRTTKRSSIISNKLRSLVNSGSTKEKPKPRPKSLDLDTFLNRDNRDEKERSRSTNSLERNKTTRVKVPDSLLHQKFSGKSSSTIGPGSYYSFENSTLPRAQAKKYDFPWESLPKDWTTSVRLREISKRRAKEDRQSSSGNWSQSGTSSNRHSLDSDIKPDNYKFTSQYSLGKDSGLEEENECVTDGTSTAGYAGDGTSTVVGSSDSVSVGNPKSDFTQQDTEVWLQSLAVRAAKREEVTSKSVDALTSLSRLTRQNILALDLMMTDGKPRLKNDEESSVYSVDQEGFYTSFHNDSGLKKSTNTLVDEEEYSGVKDSQSVCSVDSVIHVTDSNKKFAGLRKGGSQPKVLSKVNPPAPPPRVSSQKDLAAGDNYTESSKTPELLSFPSQDSSVSESDQEAVFTRVKNKTQISSTSFPSLVTVSASEDESSPNNSYKKPNKHKDDDYIFNESDSLEGYKGTSSLSFVSPKSGSSLNSSSDGSFAGSESSLKHSKSALECTDQGYNSLTLPKGSHSNKKIKNKSEPSYRSWPRSHKTHPTTGILKTPEKDQDFSRPPKTLNFAPVVNLFNPGTKYYEQMPLPSPTNSSSSEGNISSSTIHMNSFPTASSSDTSYKLSVPVGSHQNKNMKGSQEMDSKTGLPLKYQPVITVTPRSRSGDRRGSDRSGAYVKLNPDSNPNKAAALEKVSISKPSAQSTPHISQSQRQAPPNLYAVSPVLAQKESNKQVPNDQTNSDGYMDMQSLKSVGSLGSLASSDSLSLNDNSTYMSMSSPCSSPNLSHMDFSISNTPSGSLDSLLDLRRTPTNGLETDTYQINTNLNRNESNNNKIPDSAKTVSSGTVGYNSRDPELNVSSGSSMSGRRSLDSSHDLTRVTHLSNFSTPGSAKSVNAMELNSKQRHSRSDMRKEPSYRNTGKQSLPTDATTYGKSLLVDTRQKIEQTANLHQALQSQKNMKSSQSCPNGFNITSSSSETLNGRKYSSGSASSQDQNRRSFPSYNSGNSSQAKNDNSPKCDSYRVAMGSAKTRNSSYRAATSQSKSYPVLPPSKQSGPYRVAMDMSPNPKLNFDEDVMSRADSYRIAVRNTNGIIPDVANRNTSYRVAIDDAIDIGTHSKLDALSLNDSRSPSGGRDIRRMGITDVDQAKGISGKSQTLSSEKSQAVTSGKSQSKDSKSVTAPPQNGRQKSDRIRKVTQTDVDPIEIVSSIDNNRNETRKSNKNNQNRSSTYIQFDPIFEDDDFTASTETLTMGMSVNPSPKSSIQNISHNSLNSITGSRSKSSLMNGGVSRDANYNVKTVKSSKSGNTIEIEDDWRFSQV